MNNKKFKKKPECKNRELINNEIKINALAKHPKIVELNSSYDYKEFVLILMEYLDNRDLKYFIKQFHMKNPNSQLSEVLCGFFMLQILNAMHYLKMNNILHRDIKPDNIMLTSNYVAKVGDFSLSRQIDNNSKFMTSRSGTLPYLAPECVKKRIQLTAASSYKTDMFSLGIVMYFFLFNNHPFQFKNNISITEYTHNLMKEPTFEGNKITKCCQDFLNKLLSKKIKKRMSVTEAINHPWVVKIKDKVDDITHKYSNDPEKMIIKLNNSPITDAFFDGHERSTTIGTTLSENDLESNEQNILKDKYLTKKRNRP